MASLKHFSDPRPDLISAARDFHARGWMVGTAGNLSARLPDGSFWITASGRAKGKLNKNDFIRMTVDGEILEKLHSHDRPSAETSIHQAIYRLFPDAQACYHVHSIEANLVSRFTDQTKLLLPPIEIIKGLGIWEENPEVLIDLFPNYLEVPRIANEIFERFSLNLPTIPALLIVTHGITVWANSTQAAYNYVEVAEYIFKYMVSARQIGLA